MIPRIKMFQITRKWRRITNHSSAIAKIIELSTELGYDVEPEYPIRFIKVKYPYKDYVRIKGRIDTALFDRNNKLKALIEVESPITFDVNNMRGRFKTTFKTTFMKLRQTDCGIKLIISSYDVIKNINRKIFKEILNDTHGEIMVFLGNKLMTKEDFYNGGNQINLTPLFSS